MKDIKNVADFVEAKTGHRPSPPILSRVEKLEQDKANLIESVLQKGDELYEVKKELKDLKDGIRNLTQVGLEDSLWVDVEDLEKLLKGDK